VNEEQPQAFASLRFAQDDKIFEWFSLVASSFERFC